MKAEETSIVRRVFEKKVSRVAIIGFIVIIVLGGLFLGKILKTNSSSKSTAVQQTAKVVRGNIGISISGSGSITSSNRMDVSPAVNGTITKVFFKEGDKVKAGDVMFQIDDSNAKANIENIKSNILQNQLNQSTGNNDVSKLVVRAAISGQVSGITANIGDALNKGTILCTISDKSKLKLLLPFSSADINSIKTGLTATVNLQDIMESVAGTVTYISDSSYTTSVGGDLYSVEITMNNPGALKPGMKANADINTSKGAISSTDVGILTITNNQAVRTDTGGTLKSINIKENQNVKAGDILFDFENNDMMVSKQSNDLKLQALEVQLNDAQKTLDNYSVKAPIDGEITVQTTIVGSVVNSGTVISTIADTGHMQFEIPVDELDISKVQVGQTASITVDALSETSTKPLTGKVSKIAIEGTSSNGVTTYPVTVQIDEAANLKGGMNVNADISISQKTDVLYIPIEAVQKFGNRAVVMVKADAKTVAAMKNGGNAFNGGGVRPNRNNGSASGTGNANGTGRTNGSGTGQTGNANSGSRRQGYGGNMLANNPYYANAVPKMVEIGINNENSIEIVSGLNEGDEVILPPVVAASNNTSASSAGGFGGLGGGANRNFGGGGGGNFGGGNNNGGNVRSNSNGNNGNGSGGSGARSPAGG